MKFAPLSWCRTACLAAPLIAATATVAGAPARDPLPVATPSASGFSPARLERLRAFMDSATGPGGYIGAAVVIARHGKLVEWRAFGRRDLAQTAPMQRDSIFRIYSMTKTITSVAVLMLMEEGRLALDDPVADYLPEFANVQVFAGGSADRPQLRAPTRPITIHQLLTHTAGFAVGGPGIEEATRLLARTDPSAATDLKDFVERLSRAPLAADPGQRFSYDGVSLEVLSRLVEVVGEMPFDLFLKRRILDPLGMTDTGFSVPEVERSRIADISATGPTGSLVLAAGRSAARPGEPLNAYPSGAGGLYSTAADFLRFCQMLLNGGELDGVSIIGRKTVELMMLNHLTRLDPPVTSFSDAEGFGLGGSVLIDVARRGRPGSLGQFGWSGAASTYFTIDPKEDLIAILLMQHLPRDGRPDLPRISSRFYDLVYQALVP
jgi:CubicO group peptidase (beta-lactamase class C family)